MFGQQEPEYTLKVTRSEAFNIIGTLKKLPMEQVEQTVSKLTNQVVEQEQKLNDEQFEAAVKAYEERKKAK